MTLKDAKPGRYKPTCRKCGERFSLRIHEDQEQRPTVKKLAPKASPPSVDPSQQTRAEQAGGSKSPKGKSGKSWSTRETIDLDGAAPWVSAEEAAAGRKAADSPPEETIAEPEKPSSLRKASSEDPKPKRGKSWSTRETIDLDGAAPWVSAEEAAAGRKAVDSPPESPPEETIAEPEKPSTPRKASSEDPKPKRGKSWSTRETIDLDGAAPWVSAEEAAADATRELPVEKTAAEPRRPPATPSPPASEPEVTGEWSSQETAEPGATGEWQAESPSGPGVAGPGVAGPGAGPGSASPTAATSTPAGDAGATEPGRRLERTLPERAAQPTRDDAPSADLSRQAAARSLTTGMLLGGYRILRELGRGAMGAVYLANQQSLDRNVALKVIQEQLCKNPRFIARFTREAYAAAQLTHHHVVQIYDLDEQQGTHFFSMELVDGESLADLIEREGKLDPEVAVGYVLQSARGLHYAHESGMVHRDIKPANLLINQQGVVKVADLGLVKTRGSSDEPVPGDEPVLTGGKSTATQAMNAQVTMDNVAMGTPAFMAPEQAENAAAVDHRADIYSLGCTLYVLLTGRPPFEGASALEVITKHKTEPVVRPEAIVRHVPAELSEITLKMVSKDPQDRYADMGEVITDLERFLGVQSTTSYSPQEQQVEVLERCVSQYMKAPLRRIRGPIILGFFAISGLLLLAGLLGMGLVGHHLFSVMLGVMLLTPPAYFVLSGWLDRTYLMDKARAWVFGSRWTDYLTWAVGALLGFAALLVLGLLFHVLAAGLLAAGAAAALYFLVDRRLAAQQQPAVNELERELKNLRLRGLEEEALHQFVAKYSGDQWEPFFEALFGYEAKLAARENWQRSAQGKRRPKYRGWRDPVIQWIDARLQARKESRERKHLERVEEAGLQASGMSAAEAREQAAGRAAAMVGQAAELHATLAAAALETNPQVARARKKERIKAMLEAARSGAEAAPVQRANPLLAILKFPFSGKVRFLVGAALVAACALWVQQNRQENPAGPPPAAAPTDEAEQGEGGNLERLQDLGEQTEAFFELSTRPLQFPLLPESLASRFFNSINPGVAGLILILSTFFRGYRICWFVIPAALVVFAGHVLGIPGVRPTGIGSAETVSLALGMLIAAMGLVFGRSKAAAD